MKVFTALVNQAFNRLMPRILSYADHIRWDDINNTGLPIGTFNIVSGQSDYTIAQDGNSLDILNITDVRACLSSSSTFYTELEKMSIDDQRALDAMSPNSAITGVPVAWLERGNTIFLWPQPNYSATNGVKIFFERQQYYFLTSDTTKTPGIPRPFHELLALIPAHDWLITNRSTQPMLITRIEAEIASQEKSLDAFISKRYPTKSVMTPRKIPFI